MASKRKADTTLESAKKQRKVCFSQATRLAANINTEGSSWTKIKISIQLSMLEKCLEKFEINQCVIEQTSNSESEREEFEQMYLDLKEKLLILKSNIDNASNSAPGNVNTSSNQTRLKSVLPAIELPKFNGSYSKWTDFINLFTALIHKNEDYLPVEKFQFLRSCLSGSAINVVDSLECTNENYDKALELLRKRFENKRLIFNSHIQQLINLPSIPKLSSFHLQQMIDQINVQMKSLASISTNDQISDAILIHLVSSKLDNLTRIRWEENTSSNDIPKFSDFLEFLQSRCQKLEHIQHSIHPYQYPSTLHYKKNAPTLRNVHVSSIKAICPACKNKDDHSLYTCTQFLKLPIQERYELVKRLKVCINCLKPGHFMNKCPSSSCRKCSKNHHTTLHYNTQNPKLLISKPPGAEVSNNTEHEKHQSA